MPSAMIRTGARQSITNKETTMTQDNNYRPPSANVADVPSQDEGELATRWARLGGGLLDGLITSAVIVPIMFATGYMQSAMSGVEPSLPTQLGYSLLGIVVIVAINGYWLQKSGQTIGKRVAGTRIVSVGDNTLLPLWKIVLLRILPINLLALVPVVGPILSTIGILFIFRSDKRCLHDLIAGTKVIRASAEWKAQEG
jgi:uncharacterized RDD family membrane protein YckC